MDEPSLLPEAIDGEMKLLVQLLQIPADQVSHLDFLQVVPASLVPRAQVRRIAAHEGEQSPSSSAPISPSRPTPRRHPIAANPVASDATPAASAIHESRRPWR